MTAAPRWRGALDGYADGLLYGWAVDTARPDARVVLEVCWHGDSVAATIADCARTDLAATFAALGAADHCHGFVADLGADAARHAGALTVRVANTDAALPGVASIAAGAPAGAANIVVGDGALRLHGWAADVHDGARQVQVHAYVGHERVASAAANLDHPALRGHGQGRHGFELNLPARLADGRLHQVRVVDANGAPLHGSPVAVCCLAGGAKALLPDAAPALLRDIVDSYERHLPRSLGIEHYPAWAAQFDAAGGADSAAAAPAGGTDGAAARAGGAAIVAVLLTGDADAAAFARSEASVHAQRGASARLHDGRGARFAAALTRARAESDIVALLRAGDALSPAALVHALGGFADARTTVVYGDSSRAGVPWFKPAWDLDYALATDYPLDALFVRSAALGDAATPAALAWQALARAAAGAAPAIIHVPRVLCDGAAAPDAAEQAARMRAAAAALAALEPAARLAAVDGASDAQLPARRVLRPLTRRERAVKVSLIIPTRDRADLLARCVDSLRRHTDWPGLEIIIVDNGSVETATHALLDALARDGATVLPAPGPFNFAALNNMAVDAARGELVGLVNNDIEALHAGWLDEMVGQLLRPGVGAVGAKLLWPNGMVQHGGVLLGMGNLAGHFGNRLADADWGDHGRNRLQQRVSGVTAACLLLRKRDYLAVGGMDAQAFPVAFNDVDLCLKLRRRGLAIAWTPFARLLHAESASRGHEDTPQKRARAQREVAQMRLRWGPQLLQDPAYHPSLGLDAYGGPFTGLALPPRPRTPRSAALAGTPRGADADD